ncbi:hypothetical protein GWL_27830 [Herbaspirillum sp. GW103]|nr:hypothetical protein GWL_27830 [Herbaspirillum sp. GW103]
MLGLVPGTKRCASRRCCGKGRPASGSAPSPAPVRTGERLRRAGSSRVHDGYVCRIAASAWLSGAPVIGA